MAQFNHTGSPLSVAEIGIGVPMPQSNLQTPHPDGLPYPWEVGSKLTSYIYGAHMAHSMSFADTKCQVANPFGVGRSLYVDLGASSANGDANSIIRTPRSFSGYVPKYGVSQVKYMFVGLIWAGSAAPLLGGDISVTLEMRSSGGSILGTQLMGTIDLGIAGVATAGEEEYITTVFSPGGGVAHSASVDHYSLLFTFTKGTSADKFALDAYFLGFIPGYHEVEFNGMQPFRDDYIARNDRARYVAHNNRITPVHGLHSWTANLGQNCKRVEALTYEFLRTSQQWRNDLLFYWQANQGAISGGDRYVAGYGNWFNGLSWPLVLRTRRPGVKQMMYCDMVSEPPDIDSQLGYVEETTKFSGIVTFSEQVY